ncbi:CBS domain-containing protein [Planosporangium thailandense]|uniref:CBS domain-containing protein n=1 Tax=Planosporangium thailandense TaxID=765197 RepID=A0ABX0Y5D8_9ACTN|nr:CBS domain-containing protein [Planosporangium thailandense]NJC73316.1 CBS domain-containing protein [Planosporangium thailandense]
MTTTVVAVREGATYKEIVDALAGYGVSAVPVLDADDRVTGVVSEADLLPKVELSGGDDPGAARWERVRRRSARAKAAGDTAAELMSHPAVTITPEASIAEAARLMEAEGVKRLPVVGAEGRLAGIVTRRDLLRVYLRPDAAIRDDVLAEVFGHVFGLGPPDIGVEVADGVVTVTGSVASRGAARLAVRLTRAVAGVVDVVDRLTYDRDTVDRSGGYVFEAGL